MKCLCICSHYAYANPDNLIAACHNCGRVWKWFNSQHASDWAMIAGPRSAKNQPRLAGTTKEKAS